MIKKAKSFEQYILSNMPSDLVCDAVMESGGSIVYTTAEHLTRLLYFLRDDSGSLFKQLMDITAVDYPDEKDRFHVVYQLLSLKHNRRLTVKVRLWEGQKVPTVAQIYSSATWYEREVFDMYGIEFLDHHDLRRILTDYGFEGHPLRKDFPLTGYVEVRYDEEKKKVVYEPVKLEQEFRTFEFESPWEGTQYHVPDVKNKAG